MKTLSTVERLLKNMNNMHELGRQRSFELGIPFYAQFAEDNGLWRKELPSGEKFLVELEVIFDDNDMPLRVDDIIVEKL